MTTATLTRRPRPRPRTDRFDARRLLDFMDAEADDTTVGAALGVTRSVIVAWKRGRNVMIPWWKADRYAIHIGTHPGIVWGEEWWTAALASR